jgi:AcrR family transcriptional regulator
MAATPRRRLSAEERRAGILNAALAVFSARGYHPSSIDDIAREAGISKALIYEHFESKQGLYTHLLEQNADELFARLGRALEGLEPDAGATRLAIGLDAFFAFVEERRDAWRILFRDTADPETAAALDRILEQVTGIVAALIAQDPGVRALDDDAAQAERAVRLLAVMLVGATQSVANWWADHLEVPRDQIVEMAMDFAWLGLERLSSGERWSVPKRS